MTKAELLDQAFIAASRACDAAYRAYQDAPDRLKAAAWNELEEARARRLRAIRAADDAREVFWVAEHPATVHEATVAEMRANDATGEFIAVLPHIERGEVAMIGGGAAPLICVWMDCTGEGNDITTPAAAFSVARGEMDRAEVSR